MGGKVNLEALRTGAWRRFFEESGKDIFDIIEWGIKVATWCHSEEYFVRRDRISEILHSAPNPARRLSLVRNLSDDSGVEREQEGGQKQEKEESGRQDSEELVLVSVKAADCGCRGRVVKMNHAATATKLVGFPAAEDDTKVTGMTCNDLKLDGKLRSTIIEGGAFGRKPRSDYSIPKKELKLVCMSEEDVNMKTEAIKRKLRQRYLEAEQAKKRGRIQVNLRVPRGFR